MPSKNKKRKGSKSKKKRDCKSYNQSYKSVNKVTFRINPDLYPVRVTRRLTKVLDEIKDFIIIEAYRCMPLLGDEEENAPGWSVHYARYDIVFINNKYSGPCPGQILYYKTDP